MKLAAVFSNHMVLQRDKEIYIFGESDVAEKITVSIDNIIRSEMVTAGGWRLKLPAHSVGGPFVLRVEATNDKSEQTQVVSISDVMYGEVWLNNGQSNIEFELKDSDGGLNEIRSANYPDIRYFKAIKAPMIDGDFLRDEEKLVWHSFTDRDFADVSGIGYFYAVKLQKTLGVPVGIIDCYLGGTSITCWMERGVLDGMPEASDYLQEFDEAVSGQTDEEFDSIQEAFWLSQERFFELEERALAGDRTLTESEMEIVKAGCPWPPPSGRTSLFRPGGIIETMLKRIAPYGIRGIVYYQGEEDTVRNLNNVMLTGYNDKYKTLLQKMISEYRRLFDRDIKFVEIQLPMYIGKYEEDKLDWAYLREAQEQAVAELDNAVLVSLIDCGEFDNVHPTDKKTPGDRIAMAMLEKIYNDAANGASDMFFTSYELINQELVLYLSNTYDKVTLADEDDIIYGLEVTRDGENWYVPKASLRDDTIVISEAESIQEARYGFFNFGKVNVYSAKHTPLRPFRIQISNK